MTTVHGDRLIMNFFNMRNFSYNQLKELHDVLTDCHRLFFQKGNKDECRKMARRLTAIERVLKWFEQTELEYKRNEYRKSRIALKEFEQEIDEKWRKRARKRYLRAILQEMADNDPNVTKNPKYRGLFYEYEALRKGKKQDSIDEHAVRQAKEFPIQDLLPEQPNRAGFIRCPFHSEDTPSCKIYTHQNRWHCFGACGKGGDVLDLYMELYGTNFIEAVKGLLSL